MSGRPPQGGDVTEALIACRDGSREAFERLVSLLYDDLRGVARRQLRRAGGGETLDTTGLVHETYLKLVGTSRVASNDRAHFLAIIARAMRQVIVDFARQKNAQKRGGARARMPLDEADLAVRQNADEVLALDAAMARLGALDERLVRLVECRFFGGMTEEETAVALGVSRRTVQRDWVRARAWLRHAVMGPPEDGADD